MVRGVGFVVTMGFLLPVAAAAQGVFRSATITSLFGRTPTGVVIGDCDGDGDLDALFSNISAASGSVTVLQQLFPGELLDAGDLSVGFVPTGLVGGQFNADEHLDLIVSNGNAASVTLLTGNGDCTFTLVEQPIGVAPSPAGLAAGDLDRDGNTDVAVASEGASEGAPGAVTILLGRGNGSFTNVAMLATQLGTAAVKLADVDRDGDLDALALNSRSSSFTLFRNMGDGRRFSGGTHFTTGVEPLGIVAADLNGDGNVDVVTADKNADGVSVFIGNGAGGFGARRFFAAATAPSDVTAGDLNGDGKLDLVVANNRSIDVSVLTGNGDGTFGSRRNFVAEGQPFAVKLADVNGDALLDVLTANVVGSEGSLAVMFNRGGGVLDAVEDLPADLGPDSMAIGDIDNDSFADIVVGHASGVVLAFAGQPGGFLPPRVLASVGRSRGVAIGDFQKDGNLDIAALDSENSSIVVLLARTRGAFAPPRTFPVPPSSSDITSGDFDNNGVLDLAVAAAGPPGQVAVLLGNGDGTFRSFQTTITGGEAPVALVAANIDRANGDDLLTVNQAAGTVVVLRSRGNGTFQPTDTLQASGPTAVAIGRFDADANLDVAIGNSIAGVQPGIYTYAGRGDGTFARPFGTVRTDRVDALVARDVNGDRCVDLLAADQTSNSVRVLRGNCAGRFALERNGTVLVSRMPVAVNAADFNGDGRYDGVTANSQATANNLSVLYGCLGEEGCAVPSREVARRGDGNGDGEVSAADLIAVALEVADADGTAVESIGSEYPATEGVDANGDGRVDAQDTIAVARRTFAGL